MDEEELMGLEGEPDMEAMLDELKQAEMAGEEYAGKSFFGKVPGAEEGEAKVEAEASLTPEQLQELLKSLQQ